MKCSVCRPSSGTMGPVGGALTPRQRYRQTDGRGTLYEKNGWSNKFGQFSGHLFVLSWLRRAFVPKKMTLTLQRMVLRHPTVSNLEKNLLAPLVEEQQIPHVHDEVLAEDSRERLTQPLPQVDPAHTQQVRRFAECAQYKESRLTESWRSFGGP